MGFWNTLKDKLAGKKVEQSTVLPTLQDIDKTNNDLTKVETQTVESIINAPASIPQSSVPVEIKNEESSSGEIPLPSAEQNVSLSGNKGAISKKATRKSALKKKTAPKKKVVAKKSAPKKTVKKTQPTKKVTKKASKKRR